METVMLSIDFLCYCCFVVWRCEKMLFVCFFGGVLARGMISLGRRSLLFCSSKTRNKNEEKSNNHFHIFD